MAENPTTDISRYSEVTGYKSAKIQLLFNAISLNYAALGEVAERSNAAVLKTVEGLSPPRVRIPASPPINDLTRFNKVHETRILQGIAGFFMSNEVQQDTLTATIIGGINQGYFHFCKRRYPQCSQTPLVKMPTGAIRPL
jgi:hypothetical protein